MATVIIPRDRDRSSPFSQPQLSPPPPPPPLKPPLPPLPFPSSPSSVCRWPRSAGKIFTPTRVTREDSAPRLARFEGPDCVLPRVEPGRTHVMPFRTRMPTQQCAKLWLGEVPKMDNRQKNIFPKYQKRGADGRRSIRRLRKSAAVSRHSVAHAHVSARSRASRLDDSSSPFQSAPVFSIAPDSLRTSTCNDGIPEKAKRANPGDGIRGQREQSRRGGGPFRRAHLK